MQRDRKYLGLRRVNRLLGAVELFVETGKVGGSCARRGPLPHDPHFGLDLAHFVARRVQRAGGYCQLNLV